MTGVETGYGETILVVDDEPTVRLLIVDVLQDAGYRVLEADRRPRGLRILQSDTRIDLLLTDVGLPGGMNGRQVADAAKGSAPEPEGAVHHRLCRKRGHRQRPARAGECRSSPSRSRSMRWQTGCAIRSIPERDDASYQPPERTTLDGSLVLAGLVAAVTRNEGQSFGRLVVAQADWSATRRPSLHAHVAESHVAGCGNPREERGDDEGHCQDSRFIDCGPTPPSSAV